MSRDDTVLPIMRRFRPAEDGPDNSPTPKPVEHSPGVKACLAAIAALASDLVDVKEELRRMATAQERLIHALAGLAERTAPSVTSVTGVTADSVTEPSVTPISVTSAQPVTLMCEHCGNPFEAKRAGARYCSTRCRVAAGRKR